MSTLSLKCAISCPYVEFACHGCRIKCTFLWLCQVDMQQRAQLEELTVDSVQSQDCLRESFSFLKVPV